MDIVLVSDDKYALPTGVLITSIVAHNPTGLFFHIISNNISAENKHKLAQSAKENEIKFYEAPSTFDDILPIKQSGQSSYISISTYYRLFIASILPDNLDKVLYLDGDIICRHELNRLFEVDLSDYPVAAVRDIANDMGMCERLNYSHDLGYYNAGVLLINLSFWRKKNMAKIFIDYMLSNQNNLKCHDQDVINGVFFGSILELPLRYNMQDYYLRNDNAYFPCNRETFLCAQRDPTLLHFCSYMKPWYLGCPHPYANEFLHYLKQSPWSDFKLHPMPASSFKGKISNMLISLGLKKYYSNNYIELTGR